ncbi:MAG: dCTP deaminase [Fibrobacterales bacterium]
MFLTRDEIKKAQEKGDVTIRPFIEKHISPNSIDVTLNETLLLYDLSECDCLDMKKENPTNTIIIPEEGFILQPNTLYIGMTNETATSHSYIPMFEGRSSIGRLGINTHITAGFGDIGWGFEKTGNELTCHYPTWTLEICVVHPVKIYPNVRIGQVYFVEPKGEVEFYSGKYSGQQTPQPSRSFIDFEE